MVCDHAGRAVPSAMDKLGLDAAHFERHIAYDIGAAHITRLLAARLDAQAVLAGYSRLVIDVNRPPGHPQSIPEISDETVIPGNQGLSEEAQAGRVSTFFEPYHDAIHEALAHLWRRGTPPALFSIHSFCPEFGDDHRPWDVGVLWNRDPRIAKPLIKKLAAHGLHVGDNEPYSGRDLAYTLNLHGSSAGLANCVIEINQDQVRDRNGIKRWADILADVMGEILRIDGLHQVQEY
ncbi:MAG: N-formylglutamate amidohydrolase [Rhodospirillales bacterium]|nr:N-formylglutamate amidohydrolase [Alphaproteobacteria bacterium]MBL6947710.1 N-formylglutamate amidohydrolase [Rhodospirillales bacterium]